MAEQRIGRRGRRESRLDPTAPAHRRMLAQGLRDLRAECHAPPYRVLSALAHCASGTLSEAASGRRLPTWETTRAYVTGCLRHAGRDTEIPAELIRWRTAWVSASYAERDPLAPASAPPARPRLLDAPLAPPFTRAAGTWLGVAVRRRSTGPLRLLAAVLLIVAGVAGLQAARRPAEAPMNGLFNVLLAGPQTDDLAHDLRRWAARDASVQVRVSRGAGSSDPAVLAATSNADVVLRPAPGSGVEIYLTDRALGDSAEYAGRYRLGARDPDYRHAVVGLIRGIGAYAYADFAAAEAHFAAAVAALDQLDARGAHPTGRGAAGLLLGLAQGGDPARAVGTLERAVAAEPGDGRTQVALAGAMSAAVDCDEALGAAVDRPSAREVANRLSAADVHYERFLHRPPDEGPGLLDMRARYGLGRNAACRARAGLAGADREARQEFDEVVRLHDTTRLAGVSAREANLLAREARDARGRLPA